jgi:hypothetical protein
MVQGCSTGSRLCKNGTRGTGGGRVEHRVHVKQEWYTGFTGTRVLHTRGLDGAKCYMGPSWCKGSTRGPAGARVVHGIQKVQG